MTPQAAKVASILWAMLDGTRWQPQNDLILGGQDDDLLFGDEGKDFLFAEEAMTTRGSRGNDWMEVLAMTTLTGGNGNDIFVGGEETTCLQVGVVRMTSCFPAMSFLEVRQCPWGTGIKALNQPDVLTPNWERSVFFNASDLGIDDLVFERHHLRDR